MSSDESTDTPALPVVGIGASAGGIQALRTFFGALPADLGAAYVVIIHLAPDRQSTLAEILGRCTAMAVTQVGDHASIEFVADHVYVIAPDRKLEVTDHSLGASRFEQPPGHRSPVNLFLRSLAESHADGFAVILSGSGDDGALGAKAVKEAGGIVLVQDPEEAEHGGMPRAVIATGAADLVLPVTELAERIGGLIRNKQHVVLSLRLADAESEMPEADEFDAILGLLRERTGHDFSQYKTNTLARRIARRMQLTHSLDLAGYRQLLQTNVEEVHLLFDDLLISVTRFFRDPESWEVLRTKVIGPLIERSSMDEQIRVWVAGCATGEEAYSMSILLEEELQARQIHREFIVFASDVDNRALAVARQGLYPGSVTADLSPARLERYFIHTDDHYRVSSKVRDHVVFATHSLLRDPPFSRLDLVSCRNLLIYLGRDLQQQLMGLFHYALRDQGHLFLGVSESAADELFRSVDKRHRIFQMQPDADLAHRELPNLTSLPQRVHPPARRLAADNQPPHALHAEVLEALAPPSLLVDEAGHVLHFSESVGRFLLHRGGPPAMSAPEVVRPELQDELSAALYRAFESHEPQLSSFVPVDIGGSIRRVAVLAEWRRSGGGGQNVALVTFLDGGVTSGTPAGNDEPAGAGTVRSLREQLRQAEARVQGMRDDRHLVNEDLRAANEELQSLNEEYRSTTEELETSKEELQSINEELQTVNQELKTKLEEISRAHSDIENLMAATDIATLFLDRSLRINRFTPRLAEIFAIRTKDQGRPIGDFTHTLDYARFEEDARRVVSDLVPIQREIESRDGRVYMARFRPYRTKQDRVDGVVATFVDVTELRRATEVLRQSEERFRALVDASAQMVWTAGPDGLVVEDSPSWCEFTGQTREQRKARGWLDAVHPDDRARVEASWVGAVASGVALEDDYRIYHAPSRDYRWTTTRAVPLKSSVGEVRGWVGMNVDITELREAVNELREADTRKNEFLALLGHELRNPLAAIRNTLEVIAAAPSDRADLAAHAWRVVDRQSRHMTSLVNDLLDVERIKRGRLKLESRPVEVSGCIRDAAAGLQGTMDSAEIQFSLDLPDAPLNVNADPERLSQIIDNLLRNAVKFTSSGGSVALIARRQGPMVEILVRDSGVGIHPDEMHHIFEPYYQGHDGGGQGLGLGLTLVKQLIELQGGTVEVRSEGRDLGSEFVLRLPVTEAAGPSQTPVAMPNRRLRVLIVDDQVDIADTFGTLLEGLGQQVRVAYSGDDALDIARNLRPHIAFLDLAMPGMDGHELARRLREIMADCTLVAVTGFGSAHAADTARVFNRRMLKPVAVDALTEVLNDVGPVGERAG